MLIKVPDICYDCKKHYYHTLEIKQVRGGTMCSYNNHYCMGFKKYKKLTMSNVYKKRPTFCPLVSEVENNIEIIKKRIDAISQADKSFLGIMGDKVVEDEKFLKELSRDCIAEDNIDEAIKTALYSYVKRYYS